MNTTELKALAEKATPGPWDYSDDKPIDSGHNVMHGQYFVAECFDWAGENLPPKTASRNAEYIAAANPAAILTLIADLESAQDERRALLATEQNLREELAALKASIGEPVAIVDVVVPHLESFLLKHIPGADFPRVGGFLYAIKDKQP